MLQDTERIQAMIAGRIETLRTIAADLPAYVATIEAAAKGEPSDRAAVLEATDLILQNLYRGVLSPRMSVPRDFWSSPLGVTIARAHTAVVPEEEVLLQAEAAALLGVSREYVSQLVEAGKIRTIVREAAAPRSRLQPREMIFRDALTERSKEAALAASPTR